MIAEHLKALVPASVKRRLKQAWHDRLLARGIREIARLPPGTRPSRRALSRLLRGWANEGFAANLDYIEQVASYAVSTRGPVLECGSGATTILLGLLAGSRGVRVWTLEHSPDWHARLSRVLQRFGIGGVELCRAPLKEYGSFQWYEPPHERMPRDYRLIVCDGPPGTIPGGRYGLVPILRDRFAQDAIVLLDDATRPKEAAAISRWCAEAAARVRLETSSLGSFAILTFPRDAPIPEPQRV